MNKWLLGAGVSVLTVLMVVLGFVSLSLRDTNIAFTQSEAQVTASQNQTNILQAQVVSLEKKIKEGDASFWYEYIMAGALAAAYAKLAPDLTATVKGDYTGPVEIWVENDHLVTKMFPPFGHDLSFFGPGAHDASGRNISKTLSTAWYIPNMNKVFITAQP